MTYYLFKLRFLSAVHFGDSRSAVALADSEMTFRADRLFSALCSTMVHASPSAPQELCELARAGKLRLSDAFPWKKDELYLPRPCLEATEHRDTDASDRKAMKKLAYLPLTSYSAFLRAFSGGAAIDAHSLEAHFGEEVTTMHAAITDGEDALPYAVGQFRFDDDCGLYFLLGAEDDALVARIHDALRALGRGGIGGKVSSGCGSFAVELACPVSQLTAPAGELLAGYLDSADADCRISLTTALPREDEMEHALDGALFQLVRRGGFVQTTSLQDGSRKKQEQYFLAAGSTFRHPFAGDVYDVAPRGCPHPVYRYAMPLYLGVKL